jgi:hypothetical protein
MSIDQDTEALTPPPGVGPHEGRELDLMLRGEKPLAVFSEATDVDYPWPDEAFAPHVAAGRVVQRDFFVTEEVETGSLEIRYLYFALPGEEWRIEAAHDTWTRRGGSDAEKEARRRAMGRLLGYDPKDIETYIAWSRYITGLYRSGRWTPEPTCPTDPSPRARRSSRPRAR